MEAIEESQVNDRSIMETTVIERQDHSGRIRFKTVLPSGRDLNSEWIQESDKSKAGILWAEAVRGQMVADSQESASRARRKLQEVKAAARSAGPVLLGPDGQPALNSGLSTPVAPPLPSLIPVTSAGLNTGQASSVATSSVASPTVSADPAAYVRAQHAAAQRRLDELSAEKQRINFDHAAAQKAEAQWFGLLQAMGFGGSVLEQVSNSHGDSPGASGTNAGWSVAVSSNPADAADDGLDNDGFGGRDAG